ncbi:MAG: hypothetical protein JO369_09245 [Paucibacter sp.]|nr:hypothetical protein [Roseateles sp.]
MNAGMRWCRGTAVAVLVIGLLGGCGGGGSSGILGGGTSTPQHLTCAKACIPSDSVSLDQLRASYMLIDDGQHLQALASFGTGNDPRSNVEISGTDQIQLVTVQGTQPFQIPSTSAATAIVQAITVVVAGASPYESDVNATQAANPVQFQFIRSSTTYTSTVSLAPVFAISAPTAGSTLPIGNTVISIALSSAAITPTQSVALNCTDVNGNTASTNVNAAIQGTPTLGNGGMSYSIDLGPALNSLQFTTTYPRGAIASCAASLTVMLQTSGQTATGLTQAQIVGQRSRTVAFTMR